MPEETPAERLKRILEERAKEKQPDLPDRRPPVPAPKPTVTEGDKVAEREKKWIRDNPPKREPTKFVKPTFTEVLTLGLSALALWGLAAGAAATPIPGDECVVGASAIARTAQALKAAAALCRGPALAAGAGVVAVAPAVAGTQEKPQANDPEPPAEQPASENTGPQVEGLVPSGPEVIIQQQDPEPVPVDEPYTPPHDPDPQPAPPPDCPPSGGGSEDGSGEHEEPEYDGESVGGGGSAGDDRHMIMPNPNTPPDC